MSWPTPSIVARLTSLLIAAGCVPAPSPLSADDCPHLEFCDGECVDLRDDLDNCGGCGDACGDGETCTEGVCSIACADDEESCYKLADDGDDSFVCVNVETDVMNCGHCDNECLAGEVCTSGVCDATGGSK